MQSVRRISAQEAATKLEKEDVVLLDVRMPEEYADGHIKGAVQFPLGTINIDTAPTMIPTTSSEIIVYCRSGVRSKIAAETLMKLGYTNVYDLGAIDSWPYGVTRD